MLWHPGVDAIDLQAQVMPRDARATLTGYEMLRPQKKTAKASERNSWREITAANATSGDDSLPSPEMTSPRDKRAPAAPGIRFKAESESIASTPKDVSATPAAPPDGLSVRAENVLKELAAGMTGEKPPRGKWLPSGKLLRKLSFSDLQAARNCGPQTTDEIVRWARMQGVVIQRPFYAGKSLSAMWRDIIAKSSTGQFTTAEIAEALQRSVRRKNTRIPVAFQSVLVKVLISRDPLRRSRQSDDRK